MVAIELASKPYACTDPYADSDSDASTHTSTNASSNSRANSYANSHANSHAYSCTDTNPNPCGRSIPNNLQHIHAKTGDRNANEFLACGI